MVEIQTPPSESSEWQRTGDKILITGHSGLVGGAILHEALGQDRLVGLSRGVTQDQFAGDDRLEVIQTDLLDSKKLYEALRPVEASCIVHLAAATDVDKCQQDHDWAFKMNVQATSNIAQFAARNKIPFINFSTDLVFSSLGGPFHESDKRAPVQSQDGKTIQEYSSSKIDQEMAVETLMPEGLFLNFRIIAPYDPRSVNKGGGTPVIIARRLIEGKPIKAVDMVGGKYPETKAANNYVYIGDIAKVLNRVIREKLWEKQGAIHVGGPEMLSAQDIVEIVLKHVRSTSELSTTTQEEYFAGKAPRPVEGGLVNDTLDRWGMKMTRFEDVLVGKILKP